MKRILFISLATATIAASVVYIIYKTKQENVADVLLDFYEHALGGN